MRAWIELPRDSGWGDVRVARHALHLLDYVTEEVRGTGNVLLRLSGVKLLFQIFTDREERRAMAVASNAPFSEWKRTFTDPRLCAAIVDRLTYNAHIIETGTQSFRLAQSRAHAENGLVSNCRS